MSEENRPCLNAVGLLIDVLRDIEGRVRGAAATIGRERLFRLIQQPALDFVESIDEILENAFTDGAPAEAIGLNIPITAHPHETGFQKFMNDCLAPVTRAWTDYQLSTIVIAPDAIQNDQIRFRLTVTARKKPGGGEEPGPDGLASGRSEPGP
jgi:hypothetical protein